jgi:tetratricopeptide (TPR) repeat protein
LGQVIYVVIFFEYRYTAPVKGRFFYYFYRVLIIMKHLILLLALTPALLNAQNAHQRMDFAKEKLQQKDTIAALAFYEQALRLEPRNVLVYATRGGLYVTMRRYKEAKADYDKAVLLAPKEARYLNQRATLFNIAGYHDYTIADTTKALEVAGDNLPEKSHAHLLRAQAKNSLNNPEGALADYNQALANSPTAATEMGALIGSAGILSRLSRHKEAIARLETLVAKYPDFTAGYTNLGLEYIQDGQYKKAVEVYDKELALMEKRESENVTLQSGNAVVTNGKEKATPLNNRGFAKHKMGDNKAALKDINASLEIDAGNVYAYKNRAIVYIATNKKKDACANLKRALELGYTNTYGNEVQQLMDEHCKE